jgi:formate dehydrogenase maturation protein FdhE
MSVWTLAIPTSSGFDLSKNGNAVPVTDELATVSLNLWAQEHNYKKA